MRGSGRSLFEGSAFIGDQAVYNKANIGSAFVRGVEGDGELLLTPSLSMSGMLTYTYGHAVSRHEPLRRIPPLNGLVGLRFSPASRMWIDGGVRFAGRQDRLAAGDRADHRIGPDGTAGWVVVNLTGGYRLSPRMELVAGLHNLFDEPYRTHGSGIDGQGRSAWMGLTGRLW